MTYAIADDIPATDKAPELISDSTRNKLLVAFERLIRDKMLQIRNNSEAYINQRIHAKSAPSLLLRKVLADATFISAHPNRFQAGGFVIEQNKYFILHRPGKNAKASRLDNIIREFVQPGRKAATHFVISLTGALVQMVDLNDIAYHAGGSAPANNANSVGVELEGAIGSKLTDAMLATLYRLIATIARISGMEISSNTILNHSSILPRNKIDAWVSRKIDGEIKDSQILQIVRGSQYQYDLLPDNTKLYYKPPFDPRDDIANRTKALLALATVPETPFYEMTRLQSAAASQTASVRALNASAISRSSIGTQAAQRSQGLIAQQGTYLAEFSRASTIKNDPVSQSNNNGVLFDPETGLLNNGEPL